MTKKALCLIFAFLFSIESFGAVVSDNDGSAFVTKAEFETLKQNFAKQINNYNDSIDSKIDGAISSYLNGIKLEKEQLTSDYVSSAYELNNLSTCFVNKNGSIGNSNNNQFVRGGWWLFCAGGWNTVYVSYNNIVNMNNYEYTTHSYTPYPDNLNSKKYMLNSFATDGGVFYGPYNATLYNMEEHVFVQKIDSMWDDGTNHQVSQIVTNNQTFDLSSLNTSGIVNVGLYNSGWHTFNNIEGTIILSYNEQSYTDRQWGCGSSSGKADDSNTIKNYGVVYQNRWLLDGNIVTTSNEIVRSRAGRQFQQFHSRQRQYIDGVGEAGIPIFNLKYKQPKIFAFKNSELYNTFASQVVNQKVPVYAGLPVTNLPNEGKIKLKWRVTSKSLSTNNNVSENVKVYFKTNQFSNIALENEVTTKITYKKEDAVSGTTYTTEFEVEDVKKDGSSILYVKCCPNSDTSYVRFELLDYPIFTG